MSLATPLIISPAAVLGLDISVLPGNINGAQGIAILNEGRPVRASAYISPAGGDRRRVLMDNPDDHQAAPPNKLSGGGSERRERKGDRNAVAP